MFEEKIEVERSEEQVVNKNRKKKKRIVAIIITAIMLLIVSIGVLCVLKYKEEHRYIPFEELDKAQIVLIQETIALDDEERVYIKAVDAEGDLYFFNVQYDEWGGVEKLYNQMTNAKKKFNHIYDEEIEKIYNYILQIDENADYVHMAMSVLEYGESNILHIYCYGIRYKENGEIEYVLYGEKDSIGAMNILDDPAAKEVYYSVGSCL